MIGPKPPKLCKAYYCYIIAHFDRFLPNRASFDIISLTWGGLARNLEECAGCAGVAPSGAFLVSNMLHAMLGIKGRMTQAFVENNRVPVTVVSTLPNVVTQIIRKDKNGYWAVQLATGERKAKNTSKPLQGHFKKIQNSKFEFQNYPRYIREIRLDSEPELKVGDIVNVADIFSVGDKVAVTGTSKGKGFAGAVKRHGFAGGPRTHGQSDRLRAPGSIGQGTDPGRVWKGKKMAGHMGAATVTVTNLRVVAVDTEKNELHLSGPIPGATKGLVIIKRTSEKQVVEQKGPSFVEAGEGQGSQNAES